AEALLKEILASDPRNRDALDRLARLRPREREGAKPPLAAGDVPTGEDKDLFFGDPAAPPFQGLFSHTTRAEKPGDEAPKEEEPAGPGSGSAAPDRRSAVAGTLNRWLASLDRMKRHA
nr:hypothetical protein [Syntrophales bacterium]